MWRSRREMCPEHPCFISIFWSIIYGCVGANRAARSDCWGPSLSLGQQLSITAFWGIWSTCALQQCSFALGQSILQANQSVKPTRFVHLWVLFQPAPSTQPSEQCAEGRQRVAIRDGFELLLSYLTPKLQPCSPRRHSSFLLRGACVGSGHCLLL